MRHTYDSRRRGHGEFDATWIDAGGRELSAVHGIGIHD